MQNNPQISLNDDKGRRDLGLRLVVCVRRSLSPVVSSLLSLPFTINVSLSIQQSIYSSIYRYPSPTIYHSVRHLSVGCHGIVSTRKMSAKDKNPILNNAQSKKEVATLLSELVRKPLPVVVDRVPALFPGESSDSIGRRSLFLLGERMVSGFCSGLSTNDQAWVEIRDRRVDDIKIMVRRSINDPICPTGILLKGLASFRVPLPPRRVFNTLTDLHFRGVWDILWNGASSIKETSYFSTGQEPGNGLSVINIVGREDMMIVQKTWTGPRGFFMVFAPVDLITMDLLMTGLRDPNNVALLPAGFSILSDGASSSETDRSVGGSLLSVSFHSLANALPSANISPQNVAPFCEFVAWTVGQLKTNLGYLSSSL